MGKLWAGTAVAIVAAAIYTAWIFVSRHNANRDLEHRQEQRTAAADQRVVDQLGGGNLKILSFYASPAQIRSGQKLLLCYGVVNAAEVAIQPNVEALTPSLSRCVEAKPSHDTDYKLTTRDKAGKTAEQSLHVSVGP